MQEKGDKGRKYTHTHTILTLAVVWADNKEGKKKKKKRKRRPSVQAAKERTNKRMNTLVILAVAADATVLAWPTGRPM